MNSFRELIESPGTTEEIIRFLGVEWLCPGDPNRAPALNWALLYWIPLFAEIGGKRFLYYKDCCGDHIGFYGTSNEYIEILAKIGGVEWITCPGNGGKHMGFGRIATHIKFLIKIGGPDWVKQVDEKGKHMGFYCYDLETMKLLVEAGGSDFVCHPDEEEKHIGFKIVASYYHQHEELTPFLIEAGGSKFVWATDNKGRHMGFYLQDRTHLDLLIKIGGPDWINHPDNNGITMPLKK